MPVITVEQVGDHWELFTTSYGMKTPAGKGTFADFAAAENAAIALRQHLAEHAAKRQPTKTQIRHAGE